MRLALVCFLLVVVLNFFLPRLLPGNPVAYLTGFSEQDMTPAQVAFYEDALHLNKPLAAQFGFYLRSLLDGTLGYSYKKDAAVSALIGEKIGYTLQITVPAVLLSAGIGLFWGLRCGYKKDSLADRFSTTALIILNAVPTFFNWTGTDDRVLLSKPVATLYRAQFSGGCARNGGYVWDRALHLLLPVGTLTLAALPSRYLLVRNMAAGASDGKDILYAKQRGLPDGVIRRDYLLRSIVQPFLTMLGVSVSLCVGGSVVIEKIFSIGGMGSLLTEAVYTLDYPLMQGILFVTTCIMVLSILLTDFFVSAP